MIIIMHGSKIISMINMQLRAVIMVSAQVRAYVHYV